MRGQLVCEQLEGISGRFLEQYPALIRSFARKRHGLYALYRKDTLYYVGLAKDLRNRLKHHLRDRHHGKWDRFSMYLTLNIDYLRDLETLILRICQPKGNRVVGRFARCHNLYRDVRNAIKRDHDSRLRKLLGVPLEEEVESKPDKRKGVLAPYVSRAFRIRWKYKNKVYKARVLRSGFIRLGSKRFPSPSAAAGSIAGRAMNGWTSWLYERAPGDWARLAFLRDR